jgi:hypothetical protein
MSIRPTVIDNNGSAPCIPQLALLGAMRAAAEGREPTLRVRISKALAQLRKRLAKGRRLPRTTLLEQWRF